jgi:23S rRNA (pseudouridine1915-N3)-methyltransferase
MRVAVFWIGKTRLAGVAALTAEYGKRLTRYCEFEGIEARPGKVPRMLSSRTKGGARGSEEDVILARSEGSYRVVLDPAGKQWNSQEFARFLGTLRDRGQRAVSFCVGGAEGFSEAFRDRGDLLLSLSPLTMPHELARVLLLEQLYRAFTSLARHPYPR